MGGGRMIYPYTFLAKLAQFPYKLYWNHVVYRYYIYGIIASYPLFVWIHKKANSPENKRAYEEIKRKEREEALHHHH